MAGSVVVRRSLGRRLKALRLAARKTQADVAAVASPAKLKRIEAGQVAQRMADVRTLCFMYGADEATTEQLVEQSLTSPDGREVALVVDTLEPAPPDIEMLRGVAQHRIDEFAGMVSIYVSDPATDARIEINPNIVYSGMSVVKLGIMVETFLHSEGTELDEETQDRMLKVVTDPTGSNYWANLLLGLIGDGSQFEGCRRVNARMDELGLTATFIREPYRLEIEGAHRGPGLAKLPLLQGSVSADPDPFIQTSAHDIGEFRPELLYGEAPEERNSAVAV